MIVLRIAIDLRWSEFSILRALKIFTIKSAAFKFHCCTFSADDLSNLPQHVSNPLYDVLSQSEVCCFNEHDIDLRAGTALDNHEPSVNIQSNILYCITCYVLQQIIMGRVWIQR